MEWTQVFLALRPRVRILAHVARKALAERAAVVVECRDGGCPASCRIEAGRHSIKTFELLAYSGQTVIHWPFLPWTRHICASKLHARLPNVPIADLIVHLSLALQLGIRLR